MALSEDTSIIGYQRDCDMGLSSGSMNVFVIREGGAWEEAHKRTSADCDAGYEVVSSVDIYGGIDVIGECADK